MRTLVLQADFPCQGCGCESQPAPSFWKLHRIFRALTSSIVCDNDLQPWNLWKQWVPAKDVINDDFGGKLPSGRPFRPDVHGRRPDVRARPRLPRGRVFTVRRCGKNRVHTDATKRPRGRSCASAQTRARPRGRWAASARTGKKKL
jgi:hypothetical protein